MKVESFRLYLHKECIGGSVILSDATIQSGGRRGAGEGKVYSLQRMIMIWRYNQRTRKSRQREINSIDKPQPERRIKCLTWASRREKESAENPIKADSVLRGLRRMPRGMGTNGHRH